MLKHPLESIWVFEELEGVGTVPVCRELYCLICGKEMLLYYFRTYRITEPELSYYAEIQAKCPACGLYLSFGLPITREEYLKLKKSNWHGRTIRRG